MADDAILSDSVLETTALGEGALPESTVLDEPEEVVVSGEVAVDGSYTLDPGDQEKSYLSQAYDLGATPAIESERITAVRGWVIDGFGPEVSTLVSESDGLDAQGAQTWATALSERLAVLAMYAVTDYATTGEVSTSPSEDELIQLVISNSELTAKIRSILVDAVDADFPSALVRVYGQLDSKTTEAHRVATWLYILGFTDFGQLFPGQDIRHQYVFYTELGLELAGETPNLKIEGGVYRLLLRVVHRLVKPSNDDYEVISPNFTWQVYSYFTITFFEAGLQLSGPGDYGIPVAVNITLPRQLFVDQSSDLYDDVNQDSATTARYYEPDFFRKLTCVEFSSSGTSVGVSLTIIGLRLLSGLNRGRPDSLLVVSVASKEAQIGTDLITVEVTLVHYGIGGSDGAVNALMNGPLKNVLDKFFVLNDYEAKRLAEDSQVEPNLLALIGFANSQSTLDNDDHLALQQLVEYMAQADYANYLNGQTTTFAIEVVGRHSQVGDPRYNLELAEARAANAAEVLKDVLESRQVDFYSLAILPDITVRDDEPSSSTPEDDSAIDRTAFVFVRCAVE